jgi:hypothetical protein
MSAQALHRPFAILLTAALLLATATASAQVVVTINGSQARADITLPAPVGSYTAQLTLDFNNPTNLTAACLGISAAALDATGIAAVNARLPAPLVLDPAFPVLITIEPPVACGLSFSGNYAVEVRTTNLVYAPLSPYRLLKAPVGSAFRNITASVVAGSVRARGNGGSFSEFVLARDPVQDYASGLQGAYLELEDRLDDPAIGVTAMTTLLNDLTASRAAAAANDFAAASAALDRLDSHAQAFSDDGVPGRWRSQRDLDNAQGDLVALTGAARFLLARLSGAP